MKKHFIYLVSAIIAVSFVFVSCSEDENGNNYNGNGYYNGGDNGYDNGDNGNEPPIENPCIILEKQLVEMQADSILMAQDLRDTKESALTVPYNLTYLFWIQFNRFHSNTITFMDTVNTTLMVAARWINVPEYQDHFVMGNMPNIEALFNVIIKFRANHFLLEDKREELNLCKIKNNLTAGADTSTQLSIGL